MTHDDGRNLFSRLDRPDIIEHFRQFWFRQFLGPGECLHDVRLGLSCQFNIFRLRPPPLRYQERSEAVYGVVYPSADNNDSIVLTNNIPFLNFFNRSILARIVTRRMMADSVRHRFDQYTLLAFYRSSPGFAHRRQDREGIITVDSDSIESISRPSRSDTISSILINDGCRDGKSDLSDAIQSELTHCSDRTRYKVHPEPSSYLGPRGNHLHSPHLIRQLCQCVHLPSPK
jgi:hypothetical protein